MIRSFSARPREEVSIYSRCCGQGDGLKWRSLAPVWILKSSLRMMPFQACEKLIHHMAWSNSVMPAFIGPSWGLKDCIIADYWCSRELWSRISELGCLYLFIFVVSTSDIAFYEADKYKYLEVFYGSMTYYWTWRCFKFIKLGHL